MDSVMLITCTSGCKEGIRADWSQLQRCTLALKTLLHYLLLLLLYVSKVQVNTCRALMLVQSKIILKLRDQHSKTDIDRYHCVSLQ